MGLVPILGIIIHSGFPRLKNVRRPSIQILSQLLFALGRRARIQVPDTKASTKAVTVVGIHERRGGKSQIVMSGVPRTSKRLPLGDIDVRQTKVSHAENCVFAPETASTQVPRRPSPESR